MKIRSGVVVRAGAFIFFPLGFALLAAPWFGFAQDQVVHLSNWGAVAGNISCATAERALVVSSCPGVGYPVGYTVFESASLYTATYWLTQALDVDAFAAFKAVALACLALGAAGCVAIGRWVTSRHWPGMVIAVGYLLSPAVFDNPGLPQTHVGAFLLPAMAAAAVGMISSWDRAVTLPLTMGASFLLSFALVNISGYAFVFHGVLTIVVVGILVAVDRDRRGRRIVAGAAFLGGMALAGLAQRLWYWPSVAVQGDHPLDFYRRSALDAADLFLPSRLGYLWSASDYDSFVRSDEAALGWVTLSLAVVGIGVLWSKARRWRIVATGLTVLVVVLTVFSLGPSLKIDQPWPPPDATEDVNGRLMPAEAATLEFPWARMYKVPPMSLARAVWRWQIPLHLVVVTAAAAGLGFLARRRDVAGRLLLGIAVVVLTAESVRADLAASAEEYRSNAIEIVDFRTTVIEPLDAHLPDGAVTLVLPMANDYLAMAIGPLADLRLLNVPGDKNNVVIGQTMPAEIGEAIRSHRRGRRGWTTAVVDLLARGHIDAAVLADFSLRWASYGWPIPRHEEMMRRAENVAATAFTTRCSTTFTPRAVIIQDCTPRDG